MRDPLQLLVVDGYKKGARLQLSCEQAVLIGDQFDCDVVLGAASLLENIEAQPTRVQLSVEPLTNTISIDVRDGEMDLAGQQITAGNSTVAEPGSLITLAGSSFVIEEQQALSTEQESELFTAEPNHLLGQMPENTSVAPGHRVKRFAVFAVLCIAVAASASYFAGDYLQGMANKQSAEASLQHLMLEPQFGQVTLGEAEDGVVKVVGHVQRRADLHDLRERLNTLNGAYYVDVGVGEILAETVASVYRVNNVDATVTPLESFGEVLVKTATSDLPLLEKLDAIAHQDVAGLTLLQLENTPPVVIEEPPSNDFETLPGKRIVMVVATEPTYILTEDGSRYFTGSILPSGHKVKAILEQKVELQLGQNTIEVVF